MADEYISKQAFNDAIREAVRKYPNTFYNGLEVARQIAHDMNAADVAPVVRCKDCRHIHTGKDVYYCRYWERWGITSNGFCSNGAKMDLEEDK